MLQRVAEIDRHDCRDVAVVEVGEKLTDDEQQKNQAAQPGKGFDDGVYAIYCTGDRLRADAITNADRQCKLPNGSPSSIRSGCEPASARSRLSSGFAVARRAHVIFQGKADRVPGESPSDFVSPRVSRPRQACPRRCEKLPSGISSR